MAELRFDAPLARFDGDEWDEFHDFDADDIENCNKDLDEISDLGEGGMNDTFGDTFSNSLEDLVNTFDSKIKECFVNYEEKAEVIAPVQIRTEEEIMADCQMWWTITGNYGNMMPIDWSKTYALELQAKALDLPEKQLLDTKLDLESDEDLRQDFDMHSIVLSGLQQEPVYNADEVINEIEGMMDDSTDRSTTPTLSDALSTSSDPLTFKERLVPDTTDVEKLKVLSPSALIELQDELECSIRQLSETLVQELALRDEFEYEKELKNQFISYLLSIQKKRRDNGNERRVKTTTATTSLLTTPKRLRDNQQNIGTYLTTVIPYKDTSEPSIEKLQIYVKLLSAIDEDSPTVPGLLTDYILKVLCPTA